MKAKDKINLLLSGKITMKEINALEEQERKEEEIAAASDKEEAPASDPEPDYKQLYEELQKTLKDQEKKTEDTPDYKKLYEEESAKVTKLQQANVNENIKPEAPEKSAEDILADLWKNGVM